MSTFLPLIGLTLLLVGLLVTRWPVLVPIGFALAAPAGLTYLPGGVQLVTLAALAVISLALWERLAVGALPLPGSLPAWSAILWTIGIVISVSRAAEPGRAATFGMWQVISAWLAIAFAATVGRPDRVGRVLAAWLVGAVMVAMSGIALREGAMEAAYGSAVITGRAVGVFSQPNEYGTYCMVLLLFCIGVATLTPGPSRLLALLAGSTCLAGLIVSFSRGAWVGAVAGAVLLAVLAPRARRPQALGLMAGAMAFAAVLVILPFWNLPRLLIDRVVSIFQPGSNPYDDRPALVAEGLRQFAEQPLFGQGPNMYLPVSMGINSAARTIQGEHPHSFWVAIAAEQGLFGIAAGLGFAVAIAYACVIARRQLVHSRSTESWRADLAQYGAALCISAGAALGGLMVEGLVDYPMRNALMRTTVWTMIGWCLAGYGLLRARPAPTGPTHRASTLDRLDA